MKVDSKPLITSVVPDAYDQGVEWVLQSGTFKKSLHFPRLFWTF